MAEDARVFQIKLSAGLIIRSGSALFFFYRGWECTINGTEAHGLTMIRKGTLLMTSSLCELGITFYIDDTVIHMKLLLYSVITANQCTSGE